MYNTTHPLGHQMPNPSASASSTTPEPAPQVTAATLITDALSQPRYAEVFLAFGMACVGCTFSRFHTVADAAAIYTVDVGTLVDALNQQDQGQADRDGPAGDTASDHTMPPAQPDRTQRP